MACNCFPVSVTPPKKKCDNCFIIQDYRFLCDNGPSPCGGEDGTIIFDLSQDNDVSASGCGGVYTLVSYDEAAFTSVVVEADGAMTAITSDTYVKNEYYEIVYRVSSPCSIISDTATVYICKKNECLGVSCDEGEECDPCDGTCNPV